VETPLSYDPTGANGYSLSGLDQDNNDFDPAVAFTGNNHYLLEAVYQNLHSNTWSISSVDPEHPIAVSGVSLNQTSAVLSPGKTLQLTASVAPSDAFDQACSFSSSNPAVCSVDSTSGLVSAQSVGKATITVTTHDGGFSAACEVSVEEVQNFTKGDYYSGTVDYRHLGLQSGYTSLPTVDNDLDVLVVPVQMSGYAFPSGTLERIKTAFNGTSEATGYWESVKSFYSKSSYGRLSFDFDVTSVYSCSYTPKTFVAIDSNTYQYPTMKLVNDIVTWYSGLANHRALSDFDNDGDGYIDAIWMIYSCPDYSTDSTMPEEFWAYRFWQYDNTASVSSPTANSYAWASYDFMNEGGGTSKVDAHTYIHETGHLLGLDDYYNYNDSDSYQPLGEIAMQDANITDHDIWSKLAFNWVKPYVVKGDCTITINPSETSGDCIVIADPKSGWNGTPFDEMLIMELFTNDGLNELDCTTAYSSRTKGYSLPGVRLQHVDARLSQVKYTNQSTSYGSYLDLTSLPYTNSTYEATVAHSNSSGTTYGGKNDNFRLNSLVQSGGANTLKTNGGGAKDSDLFHTGSSFSMSSHKAFFNGTTTFNNGNPFPYTIRFDSVSKTSATITFQQI
jgi:M6 family metalloprotease-like protein